jgi:hypothetical protein
VSRRALLAGALGAGALGTAGSFFRERLQRREPSAATFIARVPSYEVDPAPWIEAGLRSLGIGPAAVRGKRILLKPNLIETVVGAQHMCTHPQVVRAAAEAWLRLGAKRVVVGEGSGNCRDMHRVLEETGLAQVLRECKIAFVDLNNDEMVIRKNAYGLTGLRSLTFPAVVDHVDWIVSIAKMKTHHWAGVTLSLKNMLGLMPGIGAAGPERLPLGRDTAVDPGYQRHPPSPFRHYRWDCRYGGRRPHPGDAQRRGSSGAGREPGGRGCRRARIMGIDLRSPTSEPRGRLEP